MTVEEFCLKHTQVGELIVFRKDGWISGSTWIDHEDLFAIPESFINKIVKGDSWQELTLGGNYYGTINWIFISNVFMYISPLED